MAHEILHLQTHPRVVDYATDSSFMEQVPETMKSSLSVFQKRSKAIAEDRKEAKLQLFNDIVAIRDTLPLDFLFEHNLTGFVVERGMRKAGEQILEKFRNRALSFGFEHWTTWNKWSREKQKEEQMRQFAMAHGQEKLKQFFVRFLHNKISAGFTKWSHFVEICQENERIAAARILQEAYRHRKLRNLLYRRHLIRFSVSFDYRISFVASYHVDR